MSTIPFAPIFFRTILAVTPFVCIYGSRSSCFTSVTSIYILATVIAAKDRKSVV